MLSSDFSEIVVEFYWPIELSNSTLNNITTFETSICDYTLDSNTINLLGIDTKCK
jgi:hypothetical protein